MQRKPRGPPLLGALCLFDGLAVVGQSAFSVFDVSSTELTVTFIDSAGTVLYKVRPSPERWPAELAARAELSPPADPGDQAAG